MWVMQNLFICSYRSDSARVFTSLYGWDMRSHNLTPSFKAARLLELPRHGSAPLIGLVQSKSLPPIAFASLCHWLQ